MPRGIKHDPGASEKECPLCNEVLPIDSFYQRKTGRRDTYCKMCRRALSRKDFEDNREARVAAQVEYRKLPDAARKRRLLDVRNKYGLSEEQYDALPKACQICNSVDSLAIDHDHACCPGVRSCGACVRGVLCDACNRGIGFMRDSPERLIAAAVYLGNFTN